MKWIITFITILYLVAVVLAEEDAVNKNDGEFLIRNDRGAKNRENCRYVKGQWTDCEQKTNMRTRTLTLKKGDPSACEATKTIQKKCVKACRYDKSQWSACSANGEMTRVDKLKSNSDPSCEQNRQVTKKCNKNKPAKSPKVKGRRNRQ